MDEQSGEGAGGLQKTGVTSALVISDNLCPATAPELVAEVEAARAYRLRSRSANTLRAYASDWRQFQDWCWGRGLKPLPALPEVVPRTWPRSPARAAQTAPLRATSRRSPGSIAMRACRRRPRTTRTS